MRYSSLSRFEHAQSYACQQLRGLFGRVDGGKKKKEGQAGCWVMESGVGEELQENGMCKGYAEWLECEQEDTHLYLLAGLYCTSLSLSCRVGGVRQGGRMCDK